jgi:hypothetical protein
MSSKSNFGLDESIYFISDYSYSLLSVAFYLAQYTKLKLIPLKITIYLKLVAKEVHDSTLI